MIAPHSISIATPERSIILAPFGEAHLRSVLPVPDSLLKYQPAFFIPYAKDPDPRRLMQGEEDVDGGLTWGIFNAEKASDHIPPEMFIGMIALYDKGDGTQEVATSIFRPDFEGRGIGTLSKVGLVNFGLSSGVKTFVSESSLSNRPAHRSLAKAGFVQTGVGDEPYELGNGTIETMTKWQLHSKEVLDGMPASEQKDAFIAGHRTYLRALARMTIELRVKIPHPRP